MPLKAPPIANYDWSGFCGHVGYSRGYGRNTLFDPNPTAASSSFGSLFGGLQFGYNYLLPSQLVCTENLSSGVVVVKSAKDGA